MPVNKVARKNRVRHLAFKNSDVSQAREIAVFYELFYEPPLTNASTVGSNQFTNFFFV
jgi:hypothetical protein